MADTPRSISWEAPEHHHTEKTNDWYWSFGILAVAAAIVSVLLNNLLFGIVIILGTITTILFARREPQILIFEVAPRGVRVGSTFYPYETLEAFSLDEECTHNAQLILKSKQLFMPLIMIPVPDELVPSVDLYLAQKLTEVRMYEPLSHKILEFFGF
jgi:hypothetical protein